MTYAISRLKAAINAWYWVVHFWRQGKLYYKRFYDIKCGGSGKARAAAIAWRDQELKEIEALTMRDFHQQVRSNNVSGVAGLCPGQSTERKREENGKVSKIHGLDYSPVWLLCKSKYAS